MTLLDTPRATGAAPRSRRAPVWLAVLAASLPMFMATLDNLVMTTALPVVRVDLDASVGQLSWFLNAYTLAFATFMLPAATLICGMAAALMSSPSTSGASTSRARGPCTASTAHCSVTLTR